MAKKKSAVWQARMKKAPSKRHVEYCAGWDVRARPMADSVLVPWDIWVNQAHALMLRTTGIINKRIHTKLQRALAAVERDWQTGRFSLDPALEDVHINVERAVTERAGEEAGGRIHTARSRNDQTATDIRLFIRNALIEFQAELIELVLELIAQGRKHAGTLMAGLSHTQPSCVMTFGHFLCSHAQALLRDVGQMRATYAAINVCPLGSAAGYGTSWPIDREATARWLGFDGVQENSIECVASRWEMEARVVTDLAFAASHLAMLAQDLVLFSQPWIGFLAFDDRHVTGSSIMPQKRNPDFAEVTRAKAAVVHGVLQSLFGLNKGMVSGYNRDSQWSKYLVMQAVDELRETPAVFREAIGALEVNEKRMAEATHEDFMVAVDLADLIARAGQVPFRKSYEIVARLVRECEPDGRFTPEKVGRALAEEGLKERIARHEWEAAIDPTRVIETKSSVGGPAPAAVRSSLKRLETVARGQQRWNAKCREGLVQARQTMLKEIEKQQ